jgi:beta-glucanase (GH16 family)/glycerophosphoryl diester phosphodiesterase
MSLFHLALIPACFTSLSFSKNADAGKIAFAENVVVAHRGAWKKNNLPQNSIASLKNAIELKYTGSEFDVRMTADDSLIINHDPNYNNLPIEKTNYADLIAYKLSNGEKLPTLREYLLAGIENNNSTRLVCEIKPSEISKERGKEIASKVVQMVDELKARQLVVYISFDYDILKRIIEINPKANTQYLEGNKSPEQLKADGISGADYHFSVFKNHPEWIESAKKNNITLNAWTVNNAEDMDWLLANNFDFITTNEPELLQQRIKVSPKTAGLKLVWSDEFNYNGEPDSTKWGYNIGAHRWGNNELEYYTNRPENVTVQNGVLKITAVKENYEGSPYTSARLISKNKFAFTYGKVEIRAKLPAGVGTWPALWMLGNNIDSVGWPQSGEIDIMEQRGSELNKIFGTLHYPGRSGGNADGSTTVITNATTEFHIYSLEWSPSSIKIFVDGLLYHTVINSVNLPFNHDFFLIMNIAMGGDFGGSVDPAFKSASMDVDYIRVYK